MAKFALKIWRLRSEGYTERAIFIMFDQEVSIRYIDIHDIGQQPDNDVLFSELEKLNPPIGPRSTRPSTQELPHGGVVMYCTAGARIVRRRRRLAEKANNTPILKSIITTYPGASKQVLSGAKGNLTTPRLTSMEQS